MMGFFGDGVVLFFDIYIRCLVLLKEFIWGFKVSEEQVKFGGFICLLRLCVWKYYFFKVFESGFFFEKGDGELVLKGMICDLCIDFGLQLLFVVC